MWSKTLLFFSFLTFYLSFQSFKENFSLLLSYSFSNLSSTNLEFLLIFDWISLTFTSTVLFISSMVLLFSDEYMIEEKNKNRFILLLLFFVLSMLLFISSPNLMSLLLGWDGLGLVSYCLVIYYQNPRSLNAGLLTILSNRIGDVLILMAIALTLSFGSWDILSMNLNFNSPFVFFFILLAAMTKSAQVPFSAWLPAAMAAPTPISALVHSSTLVTAGVYLLIRFQNMFPKGLSTFLLISATLTMLMAGLSATLETDLKKIIALSTLSQLAIMMLALALHFWKLAYFHMITHAMFKALMFLCAGFIIHNAKNNQDIRKMGALLLSAPTVSTCLMISSITLMGFPFTSGFFSKDLILEGLLTSQSNQIISLLILISFGLTMMYSFRLAFSALWTSNMNYKNTSAYEKNEMTTPISFLTLLALTLGAALNWIIMNSSPFFLPPLLKTSGILLILFGMLLGFILWVFLSPLNLHKQNLFFLTNMWYLPSLSPKPFLSLLPTSLFLKSFEFGWSEKIGPQGIYLSTKYPAQALTLSQKNSPLFLLTTTSMALLLFLLF
uniref:NADH dehydrogenase subunit 5 n=1 Tax=Mesobuthus eupeus TaxID=34648 RepID=UPI0023D8257F|nr:NADH dehydrogenase subunit 5 [Mesobuthus eupeus]WDA95753.1 NADH dehydrogenase subunit 5 [Mesobuthus eupeus]